MASVKKNITLTPDLLERMDTYCKKYSITRSGLVSLAVAQYLNAVEQAPNLNKALALMGVLSEKVGLGDVDSEDFKNKLSELEKVSAQMKFPYE